MVHLVIVIVSCYCVIWQHVIAPGMWLSVG